MPNNHTDIAKLINADWAPKYMVYVAPVLAMAMIINQFMNLKSFDLFGMPTLTSVITFPISLITCDVLTEVYGYKRTRKLIYVCLGLVVATMGFLQIAVYLPPASDYLKNAEFAAFFGQLPRLAMASILGYFTGEIINSYTLSWLKTKTQGRFFYFRALGSTAISLIISGSVFFIVALGGVMSIQTMFSSLFVSVGLNLIYETFCLPLTYWIVNKLKSLEGVDYYEA